MHSFLYPVAAPGSTDYFLFQAQIGKTFTDVTPPSSTYNRGIIEKFNITAAGSTNIVSALNCGQSILTSAFYTISIVTAGLIYTSADGINNNYYSLVPDSKTLAAMEINDLSSLY